MLALFNRLNMRLCKANISIQKKGTQKSGNYATNYIFLLIWKINAKSTKMLYFSFTSLFERQISISER